MTSRPDSVCVHQEHRFSTLVVDIQVILQQCKHHRLQSFHGHVEGFVRDELKWFVVSFDVYTCMPQITDMRTLWRVVLS